MSQTAERHEFQAEVKQLLDLMIHSLYSDKDIFLRELISNASDALDKRRFEALTSAGGTGDTGDAGDLHIRLDVDRAQRTLTIADNGVGMTRDEVVRNIGTIARSGTREFLAMLKEAQRTSAPPELIGQFGVGFYSAFMVADRITLETRRAGHPEATRWESTGDGTYTLSSASREQPGTTITLHLAPIDGEHGHDYASEDVVVGIVKRYSDFVAYPVRMKRVRTRPGGEPGAAPQIEVEDQTLNSMKAIWDRPRSEVTDEEYKEFYHHVSHDWAPPLRTIPVHIEGSIEAYALLYLPSQPPFDLYSPEMKRGVQLYVKRVFVMDECRELLPPYLRFVRGVVDSHDLSLNVSREILQKDRQIQVIRKQLIKRVLGTLDEFKRDQRAEYQTFWKSFGPVLKEGLLGAETRERSADHDKLLDLMLATTTHDAATPTTLAEYVERMKEGQDAIYALVGLSPDAVARSPLLEGFAARGYEVLLFADPIDELWLEQTATYQGKPLRSIGKGTVELGTAEEREQAAAALQEQHKAFGDLLLRLRAELQDQVKEVRLTQRLTSSAACLVGGEHDLSPRLQRMLEQMGQAPPPTRPILELNPENALVGRLRDLFAADRDDPRLGLCARLLLGQAHLADTGQVPDPAGFSQALADLMLRAV